MKSIFNTCFLILGCLVWIVALLIILVGAIGVLNITFKEVFGIDLIRRWRDGYSKRTQDDTH